MKIIVLGAGSWGTALAISASGNAHAQNSVTLWARDEAQVALMQASRQNAAHLPGRLVVLGDDLVSRLDSGEALAGWLLAEAQAAALRDPLLDALRHAGTRATAALLTTGTLPDDALEGYAMQRFALAQAVPDAGVGALTGPSFAADIAQGKPTALTLGFAGPQAEALQAALATPNLRLYLTEDVIGAQLGGALKNVIAIAAGITIGASAPWQVEVFDYPHALVRLHFCKVFEWQGAFHMLEGQSMAGSLGQR